MTALLVSLTLGGALLSLALGAASALALARMTPLPRPPEGMRETIDRANAVMQSESEAAPFKTIAWYAASDAKGKVKATSEGYAKTIAKVLHIRRLPKLVQYGGSHVRPWHKFAPNGGTGAAINHVAHLGGMALGWVYLHKAWNPMRLWQDWRWKQRRKRYHVVSDIRDDDNERYH